MEAIKTASYEQCLKILAECGQPEKVKNHCMAVSRAAFDLARALNAKGCKFDAELCRRGGLLHDIRRTERWHSQKAMLFLLESGLKPEALIVGAHMGEYIETDRIAEKEVVYLADKITQGTRRVSIKERYRHSLEKFRGDDQAISFAISRREQSLKLAEFTEKILGCPLEEFDMIKNKGAVNMIESMKNAYCLRGKNAIVTGGNRGIGNGIAEAFAEQGANVAIFCRNEESGRAAAAAISEKFGVKSAFYKTDITDFANCKASVAGMVSDFGGVDILVNNSGVGVVGPVLDMDENLDDWFRCIDVDLNGAFRMSYIVAKYMRDAGRGGKMINISSNSGEIVNKPTFTPYNVAKAGLNRMTKCLAYEWAPYKINVNAIAPGYTMSDLAKKMPEEAREMLMEKIPLSRFGNPIEIGALAVYLASEASDIMTGAVLTIDGGYSLAI